MPDFAQKLSAEEFHIFGTELGKGTYSSVRVARHKKTTKRYAVKIVEKAVVKKYAVRHEGIQNELLQEKHVGELLSRESESQSCASKIERDICLSLPSQLFRRPILRSLQTSYLTRLATLHGTFQDDARIYFLYDIIEGCELWRLGMTSLANPTYSLQIPLQNIQDDQLKNTENAVLVPTHFNEPFTRIFGTWLLRNLLFLHGNGVVHRDLKPENIMCGPLKVPKSDDPTQRTATHSPYDSSFEQLLSTLPNFFLVDWATSKDLIAPERNGTSDFIGTPEFMSPEAIDKNAVYKDIRAWATAGEQEYVLTPAEYITQAEINTASPPSTNHRRTKVPVPMSVRMRYRAADTLSDVWSYGCILYRLLYGVPPFKGMSPFLSMENALAHEDFLIQKRLFMKQPRPEDVAVPKSTTVNGNGYSYPSLFLSTTNGYAHTKCAHYDVFTEQMSTTPSGRECLVYSPFPSGARNDSPKDVPHSLMTENLPSFDGVPLSSLFPLDPDSLLFPPATSPTTEHFIRSLLRRLSWQRLGASLTVHSSSSTSAGMTSSTAAPGEPDITSSIVVAGQFRHPNWDANASSQDQAQLSLLRKFLAPSVPHLTVPHVLPAIDFRRMFSHPFLHETAPAEAVGNKALAQGSSVGSTSDSVEEIFHLESSSTNNDSKLAVIHSSFSSLLSRFCATLPTVNLPELRECFSFLSANSLEVSFCDASELANEAINNAASTVINYSETDYGKHPVLLPADVPASLAANLHKAIRSLGLDWRWRVQPIGANQFMELFLGLCNSQQTWLMAYALLRSNDAASLDAITTSQLLSPGSLKSAASSVSSNTLPISTNELDSTKLMAKCMHSLSLSRRLSVPYIWALFCSSLGHARSSRVLAFDTFVRSSTGDGAAAPEILPVLRRIGEHTPRADVGWCLSHEAAYVRRSDTDFYLGSAAAFQSANPTTIDQKFIAGSKKEARDDGPTAASKEAMDDDTKSAEWGCIEEGEWNQQDPEHIYLYVSSPRLTLCPGSPAAQDFAILINAINRLTERPRALIFIGDLYDASNDAYKCYCGKSCSTYNPDLKCTPTSDAGNCRSSTCKSQSSTIPPLSVPNSPTTAISIRSQPNTQMREHPFAPILYRLLDALEQPQMSVLFYTSCRVDEQNMPDYVHLQENSTVPSCAMAPVRPSYDYPIQVARGSWTRGVRSLSVDASLLDPEGPRPTPFSMDCSMGPVPLESNICGIPIRPFIEQAIKQGGKWVLSELERSSATSQHAFVFTTAPHSLRCGTLSAHAGVHTSTSHKLKLYSPLLAVQSSIRYVFYPADPTVTPPAPIRPEAMMDEEKDGTWQMLRKREILKVDCSNVKKICQENGTLVSLLDASESSGALKKERENMAPPEESDLEALYRDGSDAYQANSDAETAVFRVASGIPSTSNQSLGAAKDRDVADSEKLDTHKNVKTQTLKFIPVPILKSCISKKQANASTSAEEALFATHAHSEESNTSISTTSGQAASVSTQVMIPAIRVYEKRLSPGYLRVDLH